MCLPDSPRKYKPDSTKCAGEPASLRYQQKEKAHSVALAILLAYWLGHRQGYVLGLTWTSLETEERQTGLRWNRFTFGRRIPDLAGLPRDLQFRDFRATAATKLAESGASIIEMSTHSGHKTVDMARRYARSPSEQFRSAASKRMAARPKFQELD